MVDRVAVVSLTENIITDVSAGVRATAINVFRRAEGG